MIFGYVRMVLPQRLLLDAGFSLRLTVQVAVDCWDSFAGLSFLLKRTKATSQENKKTQQKKLQSEDLSLSPSQAFHYHSLIFSYSPFQ